MHEQYREFNQPRGIQKKQGPGGETETAWMVVILSASE